MRVKEDETAELKKEIDSLKIALEDTRNLATAKERIMKATITKQESLYEDLSDRLKDVRKKGYEIKVLNALNSIIATASLHIDLKDILEPTLSTMILSVEELIKARGREVKITGGIFLVEGKKMTVAATQGIPIDSLGCGGRVQAGECICGLAAASKEIIHSPYCLSDPRHTIIHPKGTAKEHAHVSIPLKSGEKVCGVIFLYISPPGYKVEEADMAIFTSIGNYLGIHIEKAQLYAVVHDLATHDGLTGLYNHRELEKHLEIEVERSKRHSKTFSLLLMDIDHFKQVNDTYGHQFGDEVLKTLGGIINKEVRFFDIAARYGGEEFCVILPDTPLDGAITAAERLHADIGGYLFQTGDNKIKVTISIGVASFPSDAEDGVQLVTAADKALYRAKESGRDRVCAFSDIN